MQEKNEISLEKTIKFYIYFAVANASIATLFIIPILLPRYRFPILITEWPGIYMVIAYFAFLFVAVFGSIGWATLYYIQLSLFKNKSTNKNLILSNMVLTNVGIYILTIFMYWGGYIGADASHQGIAIFVTGQIMEFSVIPVGLGMSLIIIGTIIGIINVIKTINNN